MKETPDTMGIGRRIGDLPPDSWYLTAVLFLLLLLVVQIVSREVVPSIQPGSIPITLIRAIASGVRRKVISAPIGAVSFAPVMIAAG